MWKPTALVAVVAFALIGCKKSADYERVTYVDEDDPKMNAAIEKARSTVDRFITALKKPKPSQSSFSIKMAFTDGKHTEHMWLTSVRFDGKKFHGTVNNEPEQVRNVRIGQKASVEPSKISDWMFVENGKLMGGETLRVLRNAMTPSERAEFDKSVPFVVD